jgi:FtsP/CotA-like multicopper oxidase with cupredoxin domain
MSLVSRRQFLHSFALSGLTLTVGSIARIWGRTSPGTRQSARSSGPASPATPAATAVAGSGNPLRLLPIHTGDSIAAATATQSVWPDAPTEVWSYGGIYPAPTIVARTGDAFTMRLDNQLAENTNIHWHGLTLPGNMDGHPRDPVASGASFEYAFTIEQRAGTYWYHPHPHMETAKQVYKGMAGFFIIHDQEEESLDLPKGEYDIPLLVQDRRTESDGSLKYELADDDHLNGYLGDELLINGTPGAYLEVGRGLYRFRILNGSNARVLDLALSDGKRFHLIGTDGGLLDKPYEVDHCYLATAERIEILIDFSSYSIGDSVVLNSLAFAGNTGRNQGSLMQALRFDITREGNGLAIPATLANLEKLDPNAATRTRNFEMRIDHTTTPETHTINNLTFDMMRIDEQVKLDALEIWAFKNTSFLHHPMHLHGAQFQILDRNGSTALDPVDLGWKDTIYMRPYQNARVLVRFASHTGVFLVHCHNLEHEDHGMMLNYEMVTELGVEDSPEAPAKLDLR